MNKIFFSILITFISLGSISAQTFNGNLNPSPAQNPVKLNSSDTLRILCALVEFQEDRFDQTYGNGKFGSIYSKDYGNDIIDPLPHDVNYFSNHMKFAENYFRKVSKGKANISYSFLPGIVTVSQPMRNYSPAQSSENYSELGDFAEEVWQKADQNFSGYQFSDYDLFFIFHAGVGRDIEEVTVDFGRYDLPSIYLSSEQLKKIFGNDFQGFSVQNGSFQISNTAILPETENREVSGVGQTILLELTINGLIVSTIASHLGLPDLYNTETGSTAIGRFGLMDGQAFFAYSGLFPPEPSAWEKIYLGWEEPVTIQPGNYNITLTSNLTAAFGDTTILKVPINSSEYFLIENRKRDAHKDGAVITSIVNGIENTQTFANDDTAGFNPFLDVRLVNGVVTDVDEYDWALPGLEDEQTILDPFEDVGLVIWHVDDAIVNTNIAGNRINADQDNKGVKVVEADGITDIGEKFSNIFGETSVGEGTRQDTWYEENPSKYYENMFTPESKPNTNSNSGANSLINITGISPIGNRMSFNLSYESPFVNLNISKKVETTSNISMVKSLDFNGFVVTSFNYDDSFAFLVSDSIIFNSGPAATSDFIQYSKDQFIINLFTKENNLVAFNSIGSEISPQLIEFPNVFSASPAAWLNSDGSIDLYLGDVAGNIQEITLPSDYPIGELSKKEVQIFNNKPVSQVAAAEGVFTASSANELIDAEGNTVTFTANIVKHILTKDRNGDFISVVLTSDNYISFVENGSVTNSFSLQTNNNISGFSVGDLFEDGNNYLVLNDGNKVEAYNFAGTLVDGFPFMNSNKTEFTGIPSIADVNNDGSIDIVVTTADGRVIGFSPGGNKLVDGLNLSSGAGLSASPYIYDAGSYFGISVVNDDGYLFNWKYKSSGGKIEWTGEYGNNLNSSFADAANLTHTFDSYFPEDKVYNWPNPVYEGKTHIRFYVSEDSKVSVKIFDLAGDFVDELSSDAFGGLYNEIDWDVTDVSSGVYFARVEANGSSGVTASKIIKIAVIK